MLFLKSLYQHSHLLENYACWWTSQDIWTGHRNMVYVVIWWCTEDMILWIYLEYFCRKYFEPSPKEGIMFFPHPTITETVWSVYSREQSLLWELFYSILSCWCTSAQFGVQLVYGSRLSTHMQKEFNRYPQPIFCLIYQNIFMILGSFVFRCFVPLL